MIYRLTSLLAIFLISLCFYFNGYSHEIEKSSSKRPYWYGLTVPGHIVASGSASTIDDAKAKAMEFVKMRILESIAENLDITSELSINQTTLNDKVNSKIEFRRQSQSRLAKIPFLSGVSESNAVDSYWEHDPTASKDISWTFSILYPYSDSEKIKLTEIFKKQEEDMEKRLTVYQDLVFNCTDDIEQAIGTLEEAEDYFIDNLRQTSAAREKMRLINLLASIEVKGEILDENHCLIYLRLNDKKIYSSLPLSVKSNCAENIVVSASEDGSYLVSFSPFSCIEDDNNFLKITFPYNYCSLKNKIEF